MDIPNWGSGDEGVCDEVACSLFSYRRWPRIISLMGSRFNPSSIMVLSQTWAKFTNDWVKVYQRLCHFASWFISNWDMFCIPNRSWLSFTLVTYEVGYRQIGFSQCLLRMLLRIRHRKMDQLLRHRVPGKNGKIWREVRKKGTKSVKIKGNSNIIIAICFTMLGTISYMWGLISACFKLTSTGQHGNQYVKFQCRKHQK